ncbi:nitroreductase family protein [candidate division KSB1 bacterium]|nr:nitroreductase family protein [candidate division KSB1 bacterium]
MTLIDLLRQRKASRAIAKQPLAPDILEKLMQAAQLSASCFNNQSWRFLFLTEATALEKGRKAINPGNGWAKTAPLLVIGFSKADLDCQLSDGRKYYLFDLGLATQLLMLQATELDLIARPLAGFVPEVIKTEFQLPNDFEPYVMLAVGMEGNIDELSEKWQTAARAPRQRNPLPQNFFLNQFPVD